MYAIRSYYGGEYDIIVNVVDSTNLQRNLIFTTQLLEMGKKVVVITSYSIHYTKLYEDWFLGLLVAAGVTVLNLSSGLIVSLERKAYDLGVTASTRTPSERVAVIAIDDASIANIGRWPWPRDVMAKMIDLLASAKVKVIGNTVLFTEPQVDPGYVYITKLLEIAKSGGAGNAQMVALLKEAEQALNTDRKLAESQRKAGNVVLPMVRNNFV